MNKNHIRKEIAELIDSIKQHSDEIGHQKRIPQIELELILNKIKKLYERSIVFNYLNTIEDIEDQTPALQEKKHDEAQSPSATIISEIAPATTTLQAPVFETAPSKGKDIRTLIGINDKFQFTKELFGNNNDAYKNALDAINNASDSSSLEGVLSELSKTNNWNEELPIVQNFRKVVSKRF